jgi:hypothetical protein
MMLRLVEYEESLDGETDDFYLVALEKPWKALTSSQPELEATL